MLYHPVLPCHDITSKARLSIFLRGCQIVVMGRRVSLYRRFHATPHHQRIVAMLTRERSRASSSATNGSRRRTNKSVIHPPPSFARVDQIIRFVQELWLVRLCLGLVIRESCGTTTCNADNSDRDLCGTPSAVHFCPPVIYTV